MRGALLAGVLWKGRSFRKNRAARERRDRSDMGMVRGMKRMMGGGDEVNETVGVGRKEEERRTRQYLSQ